ncbi:MAG: nickel-dependent hydrogenase large subunit [Alphaproteobacteria bacterium]|nr:nickel-dependent hydrogenase large subunit [Alphaproteobacteria bacterium]
MTRLIIGPFNRVEGDLEVRLEIENGQVREAFVNASLFRDFEQLMAGRAALDALAIAPRICGICSIAQSAAAAAALANAAKLSMPPNGQAALNLLQATENAADHLVHFTLFFMPDFARPDYQTKPWHSETRNRFMAGQGKMAALVAIARRALFEIMGILAGKWPHSLALQPGGTTKPVDSAERVRLKSIIANFRRFLETHLFGLSLKQIAALASQDALNACDQGDFGLFLKISRDLDLWRLGKSQTDLMSFGAFADPQTGESLFAGGIWRNNALAPLAPEAITEDIAHAWYGGEQALHPSQGATIPNADKPEAYSWSKAPRLNGQSVEVGALARQLLSGQPLIRDLHARHGSTVAVRVVARLIELARLALAMEDWAEALEPKAPFCHPFNLERTVLRGAGLIEAARGSLGHWLEISEGRLRRYQVIAPTTWNFSPRDAKGQPGPLEAALVGTPVKAGESTPVAVQHVVRSFDPCMACTVH